MSIRRASTALTKILALKLILPTILIACVATSGIASSHYRSMIGGRLNVVSALSAADKGFTKATSTISANGAVCISAVNFGISVGTSSLGVASGDMFYDVQLNTTGTTPANGCWQANLTYTNSMGSRVTLGPVWVATGILVPPLNQAIDCKFDLGPSLPVSPFSYSLAVTT
jgi:hypothetical protein